MGHTRLTAPAEEPIDLADAKSHLRVDHNDEDLLISALIVAAREAAEARTGRALVSQQWRYTAAEWADDMPLQHPPLISVQTITYLDADGARQTLDPALYQVVTDTLQGSVCKAYGSSWPTARNEPGSIRIDYTAGYGNAAAIPQAIKVWMLLVIGTWYTQRESLATNTANEIPRGFWQGLLDPYVLPSL